jgi:hypothetical protein
VSRSIISIAAGTNDRGDRGAAVGKRPEGGQLGRHDLGHAKDTERDLGRDPERPLGANEDAEQVGTLLVERPATQLHDVAVWEHDRRAGDMVDGKAVFQAVRAARVLREVATDRADLLARRIRRVEVSVA